MHECLKEPLLINTGNISDPTPIGDAILEGYAPGGELYTYSEYPEITLEELTSLQGANYSTVFCEVTKKLLGTAVPYETLKIIAQEAYSPDNFDFEDGQLQFTTLSSGVHVVGLSDGPTGSFKDMAMQPVARLMSYLQNKKDIPLTLLLSTSGDTGPAALAAFGEAKNTEIINMLPKQGVSLLQWAQMASYSEAEGVHVLEVAGSFSDINDMHMKADEIFDLGAANSVNIARLISQVPYYVASYLQAIELEGKEIGELVDISVPSGNFGNALAGIIAREMGVPIRNIIVATNENDTLYKLISEGIFRESDFQHTDSSAQDVRMPSNAWRYLSMIYDNDPTKISKIWNTLQAQKTVDLRDIGPTNPDITNGILTARITRAQRAHTIKRVHETSGIIIDPHTSNGVAAIEQLGIQEHGVPILSMETAKPLKFNDTIRKILGIVPPRPQRFVGLETGQQDKKLIQIANEAELIQYLDTHTQAVRK
ncbi:MAG TPA: threonine synthase [Patescibacteria group bacterium]|nr:threonine synthase [Patescibacteria group bacterium]